VPTQVLLFASPADVRGDALTNLEALQKVGTPIQVVDESKTSTDLLENIFRDLKVDLIVDGLLGTGMRLPVRDFMDQVIRHLRRFPRVVAIDIPSGLDCDSEVATSAETLAGRAELTVTFTAPKPAHVFSSPDGAIQRWVVVPIGSPTELVDSPTYWLNFFVEAEAADVLEKFKRDADSHKGNYGHVLVIAGSVGKTGAASMSARSALLVGAGLVTLAIPAPCLSIVASQSVELMTEPLEATDSGGVSTKAFDYGKVDRMSSGKDVLALGPGLGTHAETVDFVRRLVTQTRIPVILDADAINAFAGASDLLRGEGRVLLLTPHPGEFARLLGRPTSEVLENRVDLARGFALERQVHLVLKGHRTVYASPSGQVFVNSTGNPGMAKGGSGDVLTGVLAGLMGQALCWPGDTPLDLLERVVAFGVYLHGLAGDLAKSAHGEHSMLATDIMQNISNAFLHLKKTEAQAFSPDKE
jgi:ADP-dependent NAD(P)H-hydrate dehydratase / NAD(P)H-hydrate epimerase